MCSPQRVAGSIPAAEIFACPTSKYFRDRIGRSAVNFLPEGGNSHALVFPRKTKQNPMPRTRSRSARSRSGRTRTNGTKRTFTIHNSLHGPAVLHRMKNQAPNDAARRAGTAGLKHFFVKDVHTGEVSEYKAKRSPIPARDREPVESKSGAVMFTPKTKVTTKYVGKTHV